MNLLMRFYEVNGGRITVDGVDIREIRRGAAQSFRMVLQDTWLFTAPSARISPTAAKGATEEGDCAGSRGARADHFTHFPVAVIRCSMKRRQIFPGPEAVDYYCPAILADPAILILDEATSSVDTRTEQLIQRP